MRLAELREGEVCKDSCVERCGQVGRCCLRMPYEVSQPPRQEPPGVPRRATGRGAPHVGEGTGRLPHRTGESAPIPPSSEGGARQGARPFGETRSVGFAVAAPSKDTRRCWRSGCERGRRVRGRAHGQGTVAPRRLLRGTRACRRQGGGGGAPLASILATHAMLARLADRAPGVGLPIGAEIEGFGIGRALRLCISWRVICVVLPARRLAPAVGIAAMLCEQPSSSCKRGPEAPTWLAAQASAPCGSHLSNYMLHEAHATKLRSSSRSQGTGRGTRRFCLASVLAAASHSRGSALSAQSDDGAATLVGRQRVLLSPSP